MKDNVDVDNASDWRQSLSVVNLSRPHQSRHFHLLFLGKIHEKQSLAFETEDKCSLPSVFRRKFFFSIASTDVVYSARIAMSQHQNWKNSNRQFGLMSHTCIILRTYVMHILQFSRAGWQQKHAWTILEVAHYSALACCYYQSLKVEGSANLF